MGQSNDSITKRIKKDRFFSLSLLSSSFVTKNLIWDIFSATDSVLTYPSSFMSRCSPHPRPSRTRQSEIFKPNISCLSMLMTKVKGSPIFTFSATWCCVGSPLKIFIVHPGIGAVACGQFAKFKYFKIYSFISFLQIFLTFTYSKTNIWIFTYRWIIHTDKLCDIFAK